MNGMEQLERGKMGQGMLTRRVFEHLFWINRIGENKMKIIDGKDAILGRLSSLCS